MFTTTSLGQGAGTIGLLLAAVCLVEGGYNPACHEDCSWRNWQDEVQACSQNKSMGRIISRSMCPNFFYSSIERDEPAEPIQNVTIDHYSASYTYSNGRVHDNTFTGLNISFDLDAAGFGLYTGAIIEIRGVKYAAHHFDELGCHYLSFDGTLNSSTVMLSDNKIKRIFYDCARQLAPDTTYQITIKMAPFTSKPAVIRYSIPSCFYSPKDYYCRVPEEEMARVWTPEIFEVDVPGDERLEVILAFDLAPFDFDHYKVWLQEIRLEHGKQINLGKRELCIDIYVELGIVTDYSYCANQPHNFTVSNTSHATDGTIVTTTFIGVKPGTYIVELLPWPLDDDSQQCLRNGLTTQCNLKSSMPYDVKVYEDIDVTVRVLESKQMEVRQENVVAIVAGSLCCVLVAALLALIIYKSRNKFKSDVYHINPDDNEDSNCIRVKRIFVVHSFDDPSHNNVVLKLCTFLSNCCKFDVHSALWGSKNIVKGVNEWIARECELADKVIVLCSQGSQLKWRANYRDIPMLTKEEAHGDIFSIFLRVQRVDYEKNPEKFVVAYMKYSCEADIPQPLTSLIKYQLMDHMEQLYYHLNDMKKHSATHDFDIPALQQWATTTDAGVDLKEAVDEMRKKIEYDEDWFFSYNEIPDEIAVRIKARQQRVLYPINDEIKICTKSGNDSFNSRPPNLMEINLPEWDVDDISKISDNEFQLASLASLKQITGFHEDPVFTSGQQQPMADSGIFMSYNQSDCLKSDFSVKKWPNDNRYLNEYIV